MAMNEPMTAARLRTIYVRNENLQQVRNAGPRNFSDLDYERLCQVAMGYAEDVPALLAEVNRLRAREQALESENAAMRPVVEAVAAGAEYASNLRDMFHCLWCDGEDVEQRDVQHDNRCFVTQARAFVAAHPTAGEAEAESEDE